MESYEVVWRSALRARGVVTVSGIRTRAPPLTYEYRVRLASLLGPVRRVEMISRAGDEADSEEDGAGDEGSTEQGSEGGSAG